MHPVSAMQSALRHGFCGPSSPYPFTYTYTTASSPSRDRVRSRDWPELDLIQIAIGVGSGFRLRPAPCQQPERPVSRRIPRPNPARSRSSVSGPYRPSSRCPRQCSAVSIDWRAAMGHAPSGGCPSGRRLSRRPKRRNRSRGGRGGHPLHRKRVVVRKRPRARPGQGGRQEQRGHRGPRAARRAAAQGLLRSDAGPACHPKKN